MKRRAAVLLGVVVRWSLRAASTRGTVWRRAARSPRSAWPRPSIATASRSTTTTTRPRPRPRRPFRATTEIDAVTTTAAPVVHSLVAPGVYQYATSGFDRVDALTGARHDYPTITTITVVPYGCGVRLRWDVAVERWDSWDWCLDGDGLRQTGWVGYHEFFGTAGRNDYTCDGDPRPLDAPAGTTWAMTCRMADRTTTSFAGTVIERTTLPVGGTEIAVLHLRYDVDVVGESTGHQSVEGWYRTIDGLAVREQLIIATKQDTVIGTTNFDETYTIDLLTPTPAS